MILKKLGFQETKQAIAINGEITPLTSLRFFAALYMCIFHIHAFSGLNFYIFNSFVGSGYIAVDFFFVLSGFIISYTYYPSLIEKSFSFKEFSLRRIARLYPVHIATLILFILLMVVAGFFDMIANREGEYLIEFIRSLFLVHGWFGRGEDAVFFNSPSWSISVEFFAYLTFPFAILMLSKMRLSHMIVFSIVLFLLLYFYFLFFLEMILTKSSVNEAPLFINSGIYRIIPDFLLGMVTYFVFRKRRFTGDVSVSLVISFCALLFCCYYQGLDFISVPLFAFIIFLLSERFRQGKAGLLDKPILRYWGKVSYSLYMVHFCIWTLVMNVICGSQRGGFGVYESGSLYHYTVVLTSFLLFFPAAMVVYHGVEKPWRQIIVGRFCK